MKQTSMFIDSKLTTPKTEGVKYTGSKLKLIKPILQLASQTKADTVLDAFAGTTRVSQAFAKTGYQVFSNDINVWSKTFGTCYLLANNSPSKFQGLVDHLNNLEPREGWFTEHYGGIEKSEVSKCSKLGLKCPWQYKNTMKLDAIREEIDCLNLGEIEKAVAITSLILALDKVDSTLGHQVSYLRKWSKRSYNDLELKVPQIFKTHRDHQVYSQDIFDLIPSIEVDLAYLDPPYGSNNEKMPPSRVRYSSYYHIWKTVCLNDKPHLFGKAKRRSDSSDKVGISIFEEFRKDNDGRYIAINAIDRLIQKIQSKWILLSYSNKGRATKEELIEVLENSGKIVEVIQLDYKQNVMANMTWTDDWATDDRSQNKEFLFLLRK